MVRKYSDLIILAILWIVSIYSVIVAIINPYDIGIQNYIGYGLLIAISILRFFKIKKIKTILGIVLIIGTFNLIQYTYYTQSYFVKISALTIRFQLISFLLLCFLIIVNFSDFMRLINSLLSEDPKIAADRQKRMVEKHYNELINEKDDKLKDIISNKGMYQVNYVKAAQRLIDERKNK